MTDPGEDDATKLALPSFRLRRRRTRQPAVDDVPAAAGAPPDDGPPATGAVPEPVPDEPEPDEARAETGEGPGDASPVPARAAAAVPRVDLSAWLAVTLTGVVCGLVGVALTRGAARGCDAVRGVGNCGGFGLVAFLGILAAGALVGTVLLRLWRVPDAGSTSALAVGVTTVATLVFLLGALESVWMVLVIPLLTAASFAFAWWITAHFAEAGAAARRD